MSGDIDGNGLDDLVVDFGPSYGVSIRLNRTTWIQLNTLSPTHMVFGDIDGNGQIDFALDFSGLGLWSLKYNEGWHRIHPSNPSYLAVSNIDGTIGDRSDRVFSRLRIVDFPERRDVGANPSVRLSRRSPRRIWIDNGRADIMVTFPGHGVWVFPDNTTWAPLHPHDAVAIAAGQLDGDKASTG